MGQYTMTPIKGDRRLIAAIKAVGADEMKTIGEVVRIAIDTVYGPQIAAKLKGFAETGNSGEQMDTVVTEGAEHVA